MMSLRCYMLELMMVIIEEDIKGSKANCIFDFNERLPEAKHVSPVNKILLVCTTCHSHITTDEAGINISHPWLCVKLYAFFMSDILFIFLPSVQHMTLHKASERLFIFSLLNNSFY